MVQRLAGAGGAIAILAFAAAVQAAPVGIDFRADFPGYALSDTVDGAQLSGKGVTVTGTAGGLPAKVFASSAFGMGVDDFVTESGESIRFDFAGPGARDVTYQVGVTGVFGGDFPPGSRSVEVFGLNGQSLGVAQASALANEFFVTSLFDDAPISAFTLTPNIGPGAVTYDFDVVALAYTPVPVPPAMLLLLSGVAAVGALGLARRRRAA